MFGLGALIPSSKAPASRWAAFERWSSNISSESRYLRCLRWSPDILSGSSQQRSLVLWQQPQLRFDTSPERSRWRSQSWRLISRQPSWKQARSSEASPRDFRAFRTGAVTSTMLLSLLTWHTGDNFYWRDNCTYSHFLRLRMQVLYQLSHFVLHKTFKLCTQCSLSTWGIHFHFYLRFCFFLC